MSHESSRQAVSKLKEERRYIRYVISGSLILEIEGQRYSGTPHNISMGGILFQAGTQFSKGAYGTMWLEVFGFTDMIVAHIRIVRTQGPFTAAVFLRPSIDLERLISCLAND